MIDTKNERVRASPFRRPFAWRKPQDLQHVPIRVLEVEGTNPAGLWVPIRQPLWARRNVDDAGALQPRIRTVHVADDDRDMLEPAVLAARVGGNRPSAGREEFQELNALVAQPHLHDAQPWLGGPVQPIPQLTTPLPVAPLLRTAHGAGKR